VRRVNQAGGLEQRYAHAVALHRAGRLDEAAARYREILTGEPAHAGALHLLGVVEAQRGHHVEASRLIQQAISVDASLAAAHSNLGNVWIALGSLDKALASYDRALALQPDDRQSLMGRGKAYWLLGHLFEALDAYEAALRIDPACAESLTCRGDILLTMGRRAEGVASLRRAVDCGADAAAIGFVLASIGLEPSPAQAPASYVKELFDGYADHFDSVLVDSLGYRVPELLTQLVQDEPRPGPLDSLDLGCGTGLCGPLLRPMASRLVGVDLSPYMIAKSRERGVYDELECTEMTEYLSRRHADVDLIVAADVFIYLGDLETAFAAVRRALRAGGRFAFSVEMGDGPDFELAMTRRYQHSQAYIERVAANAGFVVSRIERGVLRTNNGSDVDGLLVLLAQRLDATGSGAGV
jgi:predicted TPR repeat methyltransferase